MTAAAVPARSGPARAGQARTLLRSRFTAGLAGTARLAVNGRVIPALHDAASDRPVPYTPVCSGGIVPVCVHPAYRGYLADVTAALRPLLGQLAGLPGAPVRVIPAASSYLDQTTTHLNETGDAGGPAINGGPSVLSLPLGNAQLPGEFGWTTADFIGQIRFEAAPVIVASVGGGPARWAAPPSRRLPRPWRRRPACRGWPRPARPRPPAGRRPLSAPPPGGSPRCQPRPGTPGWPPTWPRCGQATSP